MTTSDNLDLIVRRELGGQFVIEGLLGRTGTSSVYLARDLEYDRIVALKVIRLLPPLGPDIFERFHREASLAARLHHPHVIPTYRFGTTGSLLWWAMRYVDASSLAHALKSSGQISLEICQRIVSQVASALHYAHQKGVIHGGIRPTNIMLGAPGGARVRDFGVDRVITALPPAQAGGACEEMREYMPPEWRSSSILNRSADQYQLALLVSRCLTGKVPFAGAPADEIAYEHRAESTPGLSDRHPEVPPYVNQALMRALSEAPSDRFETVIEFSDALQGTLLRGSSRSNPKALWKGALPPALTRESRSTAVQGVPSSGTSGSNPGAGSGGALPPVLLPEPAAPPQSFTRRVLRVGIAAAIVLVIGGAFLRRREADPIPPITVSSGLTSPTASYAPADSSLIDAAEPNPVPPPRARTPSQPPERFSVRQAPAVARGVERLAVEAGRLFVNSLPWGQLFLDGDLVGNTPILNLSVAPGPHVVRIVRNGFEPYERTIQVAPAQVVRLTGIVLKAGQP